LNSQLYPQFVNGSRGLSSARGVHNGVREIITHLCGFNGCGGFGECAWRSYSSEAFTSRARRRLGNSSHGRYITNCTSIFKLPFSDHGLTRIIPTEEHHIGNFDPASFFTLHDYDGNGVWDTGEILKTYGMEDETAKDVTQQKKVKIVTDILAMFDTNNNRIVEKEEWMEAIGQGKTLPDFGLGPGHHWDMEMEYEIHHWEKYVVPLPSEWGRRRGANRANSFQIS
jgi:hypothetical protein